jgi:hypothetical protein
LLFPHLTKKGIHFLPVVLEIIVWSAKHDPDSPVQKRFLHQARTDRESWLKEVREGARK